MNQRRQKTMLQICRLLTVYFLQCNSSVFFCVQGPFRIIFERVEACPKGVVQVPFALHLKGVRDRKNQDLWYYSGNATLSFPFGDDYDVSVYNIIYLLQIDSNRVRMLMCISEAENNVN